MMIWIWSLLAVLVLVAGIRHLLRMRATRGAPRVDDAAIERILQTGSLRIRDDDDDDDDDEPLDVDEAARAEEEFWSESWDEPEEYPR